VPRSPSGGKSQAASPTSPRVDDDRPRPRLPKSRAPTTYTGIRPANFGDTGAAGTDIRRAALRAPVLILMLRTSSARLAGA
jgi:hypothetical protein